VVFGMNALEIYKLDLDWNTKQDSSDNYGQISLKEEDGPEVVLNTYKKTLLQNMPDVKVNIDDSKVLNNNLNVNKAHLTICEDSLSFKDKDISRDTPLASLNLVVKEVDNNIIVPMKLKIFSSPCEKEFKEMVTRQLSLLDRSTKSLDPWEDNNLLEFIKTGRHSYGISKRQIGRIEGLARHYRFSDNILLYKNQQVPGKDITFKIVPPMVKREDIVRQAHNLGHFAVEKTLNHVRESFFWPHMYKDVDLVLRNCIDCLKNQKFRKTEHPDLSLRKLELVSNSVKEKEETNITN
jgi:hypothetical protein